MSAEVQPAKIPNFTQEEIEWLEIALGLFKPKLVYSAFFEFFPRLEDYALEHGVSEEDLKTLILDRFYIMKRDTRRGSHSVIQKIKSTNFVFLASNAYLAHTAPLEHLEIIRKKVVGSWSDRAY